MAQLPGTDAAPLTIPGIDGGPVAPAALADRVRGA